MMAAEQYPFRLFLPLEFAGMEGGAPQMVELLVRYLTARGVVVRVLCADNEVAPAMSAAGAQVLVTKGLQAWSVNPAQPELWIRTLSLVLPTLRGMVDDSTIVHAQDLMGQIITCLALWGKRSRQVFTYCRNEPRGLKFRVLRAALRNCTRIVATTDYQARVLVRNLGASPEIICVIPNCTDLHKKFFDDRSLRRGIGFMDEDFVIGVFGFYLPQKNQALLLRAAGQILAAVPRARFIFAGMAGSPGGSEYLYYLKRLAEQLKVSDRVRFLGFEKDKLRLFGSVDVVTSTSRGEGFGLSLIEALACRKPVVACRAGGPECVIRDGETGLIVPADDAPALARAIITLARDHALYQSMQDKALTEVHDKYDAEAVAGEYLELYRGIAP